MDFTVEKNSTVPLHTQIKERIKIGLVLGKLRPGDTLPSIRDLEKELGVGRAIIRRAYLELQECGILMIKHGRRVIVNNLLNHKLDKTLIRSVENLANVTLGKAEKLGVNSSSFAKFLLQKSLERERRKSSCILVDSSRTLAQENANEISKLWEIPIRGISIDELINTPKSDLEHINKIIVNYYRYDEVSELVKGLNIDIIPISLKFSVETINEINSLPPKARVLLVLQDRDFSRHGDVIVGVYKSTFSNRSIEFIARPAGAVKNLAKIARSGQYDLILISNRMWDDISDDLKRLKVISRPKLEVDRISLEEARIRAGVIV